jgi:hypothetical protein
VVVVGRITSKGGLLLKAKERWMKTTSGRKLRQSMETDVMAAVIKTEIFDLCSSVAFCFFRHADLID